MVYAENKFPETYIPTVFDNYNTIVKYEEEIVNLGLWDTAGQEEYDKLRYLSYGNTHVFLISFAVNLKSSYDNVKDKWLKEVEQHAKGTPLILVGTKIDLREEGKGEVTTEEGEKLSKEINAEYYNETSAYKGIGVQEIFQNCLKVFFSSLKYFFSL
jgi:Rho family, other